MNGNPKPIAAFAVQASVVFTFPASHSMQRYADQSNALTYLGRYGDVVPWQTLPRGSGHE